LTFLAMNLNCSSLSGRESSNDLSLPCKR
jgi:hypothetical protein